MKDAHNNPDRFIAERAMKYLADLTKVGPRPTGSYENEEIAVKLFLTEIDKISKNANPVHNISVDVQKVSGAFPLHFLDGMTNVYRNVKNIVVKLGSQNKSPHSVLMNCHFDTVPDSPGKLKRKSLMFPKCLHLLSICVIVCPNIYVRFKQVRSLLLFVSTFVEFIINIIYHWWL